MSVKGRYLVLYPSTTMKSQIEEIFDWRLKSSLNGDRSKYLSLVLVIFRG